MDKRAVGRGIIVTTESFSGAPTLSRNRPVFICKIIVKQKFAIISNSICVNIEKEINITNKKKRKKGKNILDIIFDSSIIIGYQLKNDFKIII